MGKTPTEKSADAGKELPALGKAASMPQQFSSRQRFRRGKRKEARLRGPLSSSCLMSSFSTTLSGGANGLT
jgi:hypothetical protein